MTNHYKRWLIIGGASKSGTTALYYYLQQHPELCLSEKKELHFFSRSYLERTIGGPGDRFILAEIPKTYKEYLSFFNSCNRNNVAVDISPSYLYHHEAAERIKEFLNDPHIVFILRNPADKAFSQYLHLIGTGRESLSFDEALIMERDRKAQGFSDMWMYKTSGYYADALKHYLQVFSERNVMIFYYEEFRDNPDRVLSEICSFAGIDTEFHFEPISDVNRSGSPKSSLLAKLIGPSVFTFLMRRIIPHKFGRSARKFIKDWNTGSKPLLMEPVRKVLLDDYSDDILRVEKLVGRKSGWMQ